MSFDDLLAGLDAEVEALLSADLGTGSGPEVMQLAVGLEQVARRLAAVGLRVVAQVESRRLAGDYARASTTELLVTALRISPADARARVTRADELVARTTLTGQPIPARLPITADAVEDGEIGSDHVAVISRTLDHAPGTLPMESVAVVESTLVQAARHQHPGALARTAALLLARLAVDGPEPVERDRHRHLSLVPPSAARSGLGRIRGDLTPEAYTVLTTVLDPLSAPAPAVEGMPDDRTAGQRRHDGLLEAGHRLLRSGTLPAVGGVPVTVLIRTTAADFRAATTTACDASTSGSNASGSNASGSNAGGSNAFADGRRRDGLAVTDRGETLTLRELLPTLGDAELAHILLGGHGEALAMGRTQRLATRPQRLTLAARDGGCCFPGCDKPAAWTEVHHVREWTADLGPTDIDNLCLLCRFHHREFARCGWTVRMTDGVPEWLPPAWIDLRRRPRRNTTHHPPDLDFAVPDPPTPREVPLAASG